MPGPKTIPHASSRADSTESTATRRRFLMGAAVAVAAAGAATTAGHLVQQSAPGATPAEPADDKTTGYRLTEHIRKYYKTTWI